MGQVSVTLNGRTYRLSCDDGEEPHLLKVVGHVRGHIDRLTKEHGQIGDERLLLMAAILVTDELYELREEIERDAVELESPALNTPAQNDALVQVAEQADGSLAPRVVPLAAASPRPPLQALASIKPATAPRLKPAQDSAQQVPAPAQRVIVSKVDPVSSPSGPALPAKPALAPGSSVRPVDLLDATALMKGLENKIARP